MLTPLVISSRGDPEVNGLCKSGEYDKNKSADLLRLH